MNKIMLFLVKGKTDEKSLALTISRQINGVRFFVIKTDITSDCHTTIDNVEHLIYERIKFFLSENPQFEFSDIESVIQITDTDGTFIPENIIKYEESVEKIYYESDSVLTNNIEETKNRNIHKAEILRKLCSLAYINNEEKSQNKDNEKVKYRIYYMSCNLEHVLHNSPNVATKEEKVNLANQFRNETVNNPDKLRNILFDPRIDCSGDYKYSWEFIQKGINSIKRKSNFSNFFSEYIDI